MSKRDQLAALNEVMRELQIGTETAGQVRRTRPSSPRNSGPKTLEPRKLPSTDFGAILRNPETLPMDPDWLNSTCRSVATARMKMALDGHTGDRVEYVVTDPELGVWAGIGLMMRAYWTRVDEGLTHASVFSSEEDARDCAREFLKDREAISIMPVFNVAQPGHATLDELRASLIPDELIGPMAPVSEPCADDDSPSPSP